MTSPWNDDNDVLHLEPNKPRESAHPKNAHSPRPINTGVQLKDNKPNTNSTKSQTIVKTKDKPQNRVTKCSKREGYIK